MAYAILDDLKQRLGTRVTPPGLYEQLTDRLSHKVADDAVGQEILDTAHGEVDRWLARRHSVPVDVSSDTTLAQCLKGAVLDIAEKVAWTTSGARKTTPKRVVRSYESTLAWLREVAAGKAQLPGESVVPAAVTDGDAATAFGQDPVLGGDAMKGF